MFKCGFVNLSPANHAGDFFHTALVVHVDLSVLVWFLAFGGVLGMLNLALDTPLDEEQREYLGLAQLRQDNEAGAVRSWRRHHDPEHPRVQEAVNQFFTLPIFVLFGLMLGLFIQGTLAQAGSSAAGTIGVRTSMSGTNSSCCFEMPPPMTMTAPTRALPFVPAGAPALAACGEWRSGLMIGLRRG